VKGPDLYSPNGEPTKGVYFFLKALYSICANPEITHLVMALDGPREKLLRRRLDPDYKAQRDAQPKSEKIGSQFKLIHDLCAALELPMVRLDGYEADDLIATLIDRHASESLPCVIVTSDKDFHQLASPVVKILDPMTKEWMGLKDVSRKWKVPPTKIVEIKILMGDQSDNVKGVAGFGEKRATEAIQKYGSADAVKEHRNDFSEKLSENLEKADLAKLRRIVSLNSDAPVDVELSAFRFQGLNVSGAKRIFDRLGFKRWAG
jgi:DNA polymerase-1